MILKQCLQKITYIVQSRRKRKIATGLLFFVVVVICLVILYADSISLFVQSLVLSSLLFPIVIFLLLLLSTYLVVDKVKYNKIIAKQVEKRTLRLSQLNKVLARREEQFESLVNNMPAISYRCQIDESRTMLYISSHVKEMLGYAQEDLTDGMKIDFVEIIHKEDVEKVKTSIDAAIEDGVPWEIEYRVVDNNQNIKWVYEKGRAVFYLKGKVKIGDGFILDISKRKEAERKKNELEIQLAHSQRMESIGVLAAGIAHEINTPVQYVNDYVTFVGKAVGDLFGILDAYKKLISADLPKEVGKVLKMEEDLDLDFLKEEMPEAVVNAQEGLDRITTIVRAMRDFSHAGMDEAKTMANINKAIESTITITKNEWKYIAEIETDFDPAAVLECYSQDLKQVILNLVINAGDSIKEKIGEQPKEKGLIKITTKKDAKKVVISIKDTGCGIPEEYKNKIFDQFFTTKDVGKGTGQGLAIAYSVVVQKHGGRIYFNTANNEGTEFIIELPVEGK